MAKKVEFNMGAVKKYLFWACTPIGLVVGVVAGLMAIGSTGKELDTLKTQLEGQKSSMSQLRSAAASHPNQSTIDAINEKKDELGKDVYAAWETLERAQREQNRWRGLAVVATQEIENKGFLDDLSSTTLQSYLGFARSAIDGSQDSRAPQESRGLLEYPNDIRRAENRRQQGEQWLTIEQTVLTASTGHGGTGSFGGGGAMATTASTVRTVPGDQFRGKVAWNSPDLDFTMKNWTRQPQSFEVWLTQEDLWVYQALLWVIAKSNEGIVENGIPVSAAGATGGMTSGASGTNTRPLDLSRSVVKEIIDLSIGKKAAQVLKSQSSRRISRAGSGSGALGDSSSSSGDSLSGFGGESGFGSSDGMGGTAMNPEAARKAALAGRYVDADGAPLTEPVLTSQYRRMPIYLNLRVDQRFISDVLVHCANCPMPIDVLWVTVNPDNTQSFEFASASTSTGSETGFGSSGGFGSAPKRLGAGGKSPTAGGGARTPAGNIDFGSNEVVVEIYGCINIFAPPDPEKIGGGSQTADN